MRRLIDWFETLAVVGAFRRFLIGRPGLLSAAVAYNVFFAIPALLLSGLAVASFVGKDELVKQDILAGLGEVAPEEIVELAESLLTSVENSMAGSEGLVLAIGVLVAIYSGSRATITIQRALTLIGEMEEVRPYWIERGLAIALTIAGGVAFFVSLFVLIIGNAVAAWLASATGADWVEDAWSAMSIPVTTLALVVYLYLVYRWGPPRRLPWAWAAAFIATAGALATSLGFAFYLTNAHRLGAAVGTLTTFAVMLLWLFLGGYVVILSGFFALEARAWWDARERAPSSSTEQPS